MAQTSAAAVSPSKRGSLPRRILAHKSVGVPVSAALGLLGAETLRRKVSRICHHAPRTVTIHVPRPGGRPVKVLMDSANGADQIACQVWWQGWDNFEKPLPDLFVAYAATAGFVVDIGANTGFYAMLAAACSSRAVVHAFEPFPPVRKLMENNIALNGVGARVKPFPQAVSEQVGELDLYVPVQDGSAVETSCSLNANFRPSHSEVLKVPVVTLDGHIQANGGGATVDMLKIDVEGEEHRVLAGAEGILRDHRPVVFLEVLKVANTDVIDAIRARHGYEVLLPSETEGVVEMPKVEYQRHEWNQILVPAEKKQAVLQTFKSIR